MRLIDAEAMVREIWEMTVQPKWCKTLTETIIRNQPTVDAVPVIRCKDCKYFETDHIENVNGIPLIVAHEICMRWGDGCKTRPDGYCFMAEREEE